MKVTFFKKEIINADIDIEKLYQFCKEKGYITFGKYFCSINISMFEIICEFLQIYSYIENEESERIEDNLRSAILDIAEKNCEN